MNRLADGLAEGVLLMLRSQARKLGEGHVGDGENKYASDDQIQVGGVLHGGDSGAVVQVGTKLGIDRQINGLDPGGDHDGPHEGKGFPHSLRPGVKVGTKPEIQPPQGGHLDQRLEEPPHQIGRRQSVAPQAVVQEEEVGDDDQIGHRADEGRDVEAVHGLENAHKGEGHPGKEHRGEHDPGQGSGQGRRLLVIAVGKQGHQGLGKENTQYGEHRCQQGHD